MQSLYVKMNKNITKAIAFTLLGFAVGVTFTKLRGSDILEHLEETRKLTSEQQWIEAGNYLSIAEAIRNNKINEALSFSESMISINVLGFTNKGEKLKSLNKHEITTLNKIKLYKENECKEECLERINGILK